MGRFLQQAEGCREKRPQPPIPLRHRLRLFAPAVRPKNGSMWRFRLLRYPTQFGVDQLDELPSTILGTTVCGRAGPVWLMGTAYRQAKSAV